MTLIQRVRPFPILDDHIEISFALRLSRSLGRSSPSLLLTAMYDLNIPISFGENGNKKGKGKQAASTEVRYTAAQISAIESRIDMLSHCTLEPLSQQAINLTTAESGI